MKRFNLIRFMIITFMLLLGAVHAEEEQAIVKNSDEIAAGKNEQNNNNKDKIQVSMPNKKFIRDARDEVLARITMIERQQAQFRASCYKFIKDPAYDNKKDMLRNRSEK